VFLVNGQGSSDMLQIVTSVMVALQAPLKPSKDYPRRHRDRVKAAARESVVVLYCPTLACNFNKIVT
jgi:hypothetical protein